MTEEVRAPTEEELRAMYNRGYSKQRLKDIGAIGLGTAVGGGLGWFAGDSLAQKAMSHQRLASMLSYGVPVASALTAGYVGHLDSRRRELEAERAHLAGLLAQRKNHGSRPVQEKTARILASPNEWTDTEKQTGIGAVVGGLGGLAAGGLTSTNPTFVKFALPGAVLGSFIARRKARKLRQEQGYV